ncbi:hypothetical protein EG346_16055 [Chryseobacterium carnipullorum]|uniref:Uncharacterized protein n=1 Tax=Chryseobacterium carnipullorum TaxID=1124835 RepID=A0A1M7L519_CHRCU|nr:hypothetical protein [Chryseobacterium carnipullorum]MDN5422201.1 hypothetical protein [Chryseobacterium sp.]AZA49599.1 hypothetical protein EG346_16055 [Chryseobacterium carnipullorum]AZA64495.1 hypothetical protein EG345_07070 [Chryseobacterium carnipullorum]SHM72410.1 hypothetical protein SAMN05444360_11683 [Chryseobacterium carnipullorum]STC94938.1 Uncharacterised protein [Chryseobacterium carnipullorum]
MIKNITFLIILLLFSLSFAQKRKAPPAPNEAGSSFIKKNFKPKPFSNSIKSFPFKKTSKIKLISYNLDFKREPFDTPPPPDDSLAIKKYENRKKPVRLETILGTENLNGIQQQKNLNLLEIRQLTDIMHNTCSRYTTGLLSESGCYFPRNAVLFYDENDQVFAYLELCFECDGNKQEPKNLFEEDFYCENIYGLLEKFFNTAGIKTQYLEVK